MEIKKIVNISVITIGLFASLITILQYLPAKIDKNPDFSGYWDLTFKVDSSSLSRYETGHLQYKYRITLKQLNNEIVGAGEKYWELFNGKEKYYSKNQKTPIKIEGKIEKDRFVANIYEKGARRETTGFIKLFISNNFNKLNGTFNTTAANCKGVAILEKK
jgi:hypothetical protein